MPYGKSLCRSLRVDDTSCAPFQQHTRLPVLSRRHSQGEPPVRRSSDSGSNCVNTGQFALRHNQGTSPHSQKKSRTTRTNINMEAAAHAKISTSSVLFSSAWRRARPDLASGLGTEDITIVSDCQFGPLAKSLMCKPNWRMGIRRTGYAETGSSMPKDAVFVKAMSAVPRADSPIAKRSYIWRVSGKLRHRCMPTPALCW